MISVFHPRGSCGSFSPRVIFFFKMALDQNENPSAAVTVLQRGAARGAPGSSFVANKGSPAADGAAQPQPQCAEKGEVL